MKVANRQARKKADPQFEALAALANMGDTQAEWEKLRLMYPEVFPQDWVYLTDDYTATGFDDRDSTHVYHLSSQQSATILNRRLRYRNLLRNAWSGNDREGKNLSILYGLRWMEEEFIQVASRPAEVDPLPRPKPSVNGHTGELEWEFASEFQRILYELMRNRWRAKICPQCARYFIADKTAQAFCSTICAGDAKRERALQYWRTTGSEARQSRKTRKVRKERGKSK